MCKSVPQTEATLTLTNTSVRPILGMATSRTSAPGFGSGFTTASMVSAIEVSHLPFLRAGGCGVQQETLNFSIHATPGCDMWARVLYLKGQSGLVFLLPRLGHAERLPLRPTKVLG